MDIFFKKVEKDYSTPQMAVAKITGHVDLPEGDEVALLDALTKIGPIAVGVDASQTYVFTSS
jgi:hypothetical protein